MPQPKDDSNIFVFTVYLKSIIWYLFGIFLFVFEMSSCCLCYAIDQLLMKMSLTQPDGSEVVAVELPVKALIPRPPLNSD